MEVSLNNEARQDAPIIKPAEVKSDVDPPMAIVFSSDNFEPAYSRSATYRFACPPDVGQSGTHTYLITQRLRI